MERRIISNKYQGATPQCLQSVTYVRSPIYCLKEPPYIYALPLIQQLQKPINFKPQNAKLIENFIVIELMMENQKLDVSEVLTLLHACTMSDSGTSSLPRTS